MEDGGEVWERPKAGLRGWSRSHFGAIQVSSEEGRRKTLAIGEEEGTASQGDTLTS